MPTAFRQQLARIPRHWLLPAIVALAGLACTALATVELSRAFHEKDRVRFEATISRRVDSIQDRIDVCATILRGAAGLFAAEGESAKEIDQRQFAAYVHRLRLPDRHPGVQGVGFSLRIPPGEREAAIAQARAEGLTSQPPNKAQRPFEIWPVNNRDAEQHAILYLEPLAKGNHVAIGFNMFTDPVRRAAMEQARDTGVAAASGRVTLVQESDKADKQAGFLMYVPVYRGGGVPDTEAERREQLIGFVYSPFRVGDLLSGVFGADATRELEIDVYDGQPDAENLMHHSGGGAPEDSGFHRDLRLNVAGRTWTLAFHSTPEFDRASGRQYVPWVLIVGSTVTILLTGLSFGEARTRNLAEQTAVDLRRADAALFRSAARNASILEGALDCVVTMDHEGTITEFNPAAERAFGYARDEVLGQEMRNLIIPPRFRQAQREGLARYLATGVAAVVGRRIEVLALKKDGTEFPVELTVTKNPGEDPPTFTGFIRDLSDLKRTEGLLRDETAIVETINRVGQSLSAELDVQKLVDTVTRATTDLTGAQFGAFFYNVRDEQGESYSLVAVAGVPHERFEEFPMPRNTPLFNSTFRGDSVVRLDDVRKDPRYGKHAPHHGMPEEHLPVVSYLAVPVVSRSGEVIGGLFYGHERAGMFDERHEQIVVGIAAQAAVAIDNARLYEAELKARTVLEAAHAEKDALLASERAARSDLETANRMKDEFLATLSHELRTPLNAILGYASLLRFQKNNERELEQGLETIERNARVQAQLIEDLLDMNRIISGKVRLDVQSVDLAAVIDAALDTVGPAIEGKALRLEKVIDPQAGPVRGDPNRLQQVVWNLLSNAVKFTPRGGRVQISLQRVNSHVEIQVRDSGHGIAPEFLPHVFERFRQADASTTRQQGGLGLGLAIVKHLLELHGGSIEAASDGPGHGATFTVKLPLASVHRDQAPRDRVHPAASTTPLTYESVDLSGIRVLAVDDERDAGELVRRVLMQHSAEVTVATSAAEALDSFERERPHLLISDIGMPGEDGYQLIRKLRAREGGNAGIPAIALTAFARPEDRRRSAMSGYQVHLSKPVEPAELIAVVASLAGRTGR